jgi:TIR domain
MKNQLKSWIAEGRVEDVLEALAALTDEAIVVRSSYVSAKRRYNLGTLEQRDWTLAQNRATESALYLVNRYAPEHETAQNTEPKPINTIKKGSTVSVFISYNHNDGPQVDKIQEVLEQRGFDVKRDKDDMAVGEGIQDFIDRMLKTEGYVLSVISKNSLSSGWVGIESNLAHYAQFFGVSRFIPVMIDQSLFDDNLVFDVLDTLDPQIKGTEANIEKSKQRGVEYDQFEKKRRRLVALRSNIAGLINKLQNVKVEDISEDKWDTGMQKVIETMKQES